MTHHPYELIDTALGRMERWRASTLATGSMSYYEQVRNDAAEAVALLDRVMARVDAAIAQRAMIKDMVARMTALENRCDALEAELEAYHKADAERQAAQRELEEEPLSEPPGTEEDASMNKVSAREIIARDETRSELPVPPMETTADVELHPADPELNDPLQKDIPEETPKGKAFPQPIDVSLNEG